MGKPLDRLDLVASGIRALDVVVECVPEILN